MNDVRVEDIAEYLHEYLRLDDIPDYPNALNGLQITHRGPVRKIAVAVDTSARTIAGAIAANANLLLVHHGMFWSGLQRLQGRHYDRVRSLIMNDVAVYSAHLPLDIHDVHGNSKLLAAELGLTVTGGFAAHRGFFCGVRGDASLPTSTLHQRVSAFAETHQTQARATAYSESRTTKRWAICSGSGASASTLAEAEALDIDTLIVGEGPHWTAVDAPESGLVIIYAGHYATETLGVKSLADHLENRFHLEWVFVPSPTGL